MMEELLKMAEELRQANLKFAGRCAYTVEEIAEWLQQTRTGRAGNPCIFCHEPAGNYQNMPNVYVTTIFEWDAEVDGRLQRMPFKSIGVPVYVCRECILIRGEEMA